MGDQSGVLGVTVLLGRPIAAWIAFFISLALGITFMASAVPKLREPKIFTLQVLEYQIVGLRASKLVARVLPPIELLVGLLLLTGVLARVTAVGAALLQLTFIGAIATNVARERRVECGCFGAGWSRTTGWSLLMQDVVSLGGTVALMWMTGSWTVAANWSPFARSVPVLTLLGVIMAWSALYVIAMTQSRRRGHRPLSARRRGASGGAAITNRRGRHAVERQ